MKDNKCKFIGATAGEALIVAVVIAGILLGNHKADYAGRLIEYNADSNDVTVAESSTESSTIIVYITGEVNKPDVYGIDKNARLVDLIETAGGFTDNAYKDDLNLAAPLNDGEKIVVNNADNIVDKSDKLDENINRGSDRSELININTADAEQLQMLDGIGEELAGAIIDYRITWGDFTSIEEIREVDGIGEGIFNKIKDKITIR